MKIRMKSVVFGIIIGVLTTISITVLGISLATPRVEVWMQTNQVRIMVDGRTLELPDDAHILNFNGRIHTPARVIAESLGATVEWDEVSQTVIIVSGDRNVLEGPAPTPAPETAPPPETTAPAAPSRHYSPLPVRRIIQDVSINITSMEFFLSQTEVLMDLNINSQWPVMFLRDQIYIEFEGVKYPVEYHLDPLFSNSLPPMHSVEDLRMIFPGLPEEAIRGGNDVEELRLVINVEIIQHMFGADVQRIATFIFDINPSDESFYNF